MISSDTADHEVDAMLDYYFPMSTGHGNCISPSECQFLGVCHGVADPDDRTLYQIRVPNHPRELEG